ncbi:hypothetical protein FQA39_LY10666 [Lamprigera yunnana]|nr:hypothetical protein FQA39_LY10666 [Lamprigera yunnana]
MNDFYENSLEYFKTVLHFLKENNWLFNQPNTHILVNKVLDNFDPDWIRYLLNTTTMELHALSFGDINSNSPESLKIFLKKVQSLKVPIEIYKTTNKLVASKRHNHINDKKWHEIVSLAVVIHDVCSSKDITVIVDVGAGLGHLSYLLSKKYNYKILAIEGNKEIFDLALKTQEKCYPDEKERVKFIHHFITKNSACEIEVFLKSLNWDIEKVCIVGLHACADLSITVLKIFRKLEFLRTLIIVPCCYHRMEFSFESVDKEKFKYFPVSKAMNDLYAAVEGEDFLRRPFLRLACQQTKISWNTMTAEDHEMHSKSCMFRAILQEVAYEDNLIVRRLKRKTGKCNRSIEDYINNLKTTHKLVRQDGSDCTIDEAIFRERMLEKWKVYEKNCYVVEILTSFQTAIQSICESVILLDRIQYLREKGINSNIYKVIDDRISPRCHALVANK